MVLFVPFPVHVGREGRLFHPEDVTNLLTKATLNTSLGNNATAGQFCPFRDALLGWD